MIYVEQKKVSKTLQDSGLQDPSCPSLAYIQTFRIVWINVFMLYTI